MRKTLIVTVLAFAGVIGSGSKADACWGWWTCGYPAFCGYPYCGGWGGSAGCYYYAPYYPWFAYWNYSNSPYAWPRGYIAGNYPAYVPGLTDRAPYSPKAGAITTTTLEAKPAKPATVTATLPADAELLFNGSPASGAEGATRSFQTTPLDAGQTYEYTLTARVTRNGHTETVTEKVMVKAGEETKVTLQLKGDPSTVAVK